MQKVSHRISLLSLALLPVLSSCKKQNPPPPPPATVTTGVSSSAPPPLTSSAQPNTSASSAQPEASLPAGHPQLPNAAPPKQNLPPDDPKLALFAGLTGPKPATWQWNAAIRQFAVAEYSIPGSDGADQASIVVFSPVGGSLDLNVNRWKAQFRSPEGQPVEPKLESFEVQGMSVTLVELAGEYRGMSGGWTPDTLFITAVIQAPAGQTFVRFSGPRATVERNREAFMALIKGLHKTSAS